MDAGQKNRLQAMKFVDCEQLMFDEIAQWALELGFEFCSFGMCAPVPVANPVAMAFSNYPDILKQDYESAGYVAIDPLIQHALHYVDRITWKADWRFSRNPELYRTAQAAGVSSGICQPTRGSHGVSGMLNLSGRNRELGAGEVDEKSSQILWLANLAHQGLSPHLIKNHLPATETRLSEREIDALRWLAEGKTSCEIAELLDIAERTVNFHINNAVVKLGSPNRTAATVQAALLGML